MDPSDPPPVQPACEHARAAGTTAGSAETAALTQRLSRFFRSHPSRESFRQFSPLADGAYRDALTRIGEASAAAEPDDAGALRAALAEAETLVAAGKFHPELVKYALGVFWTHSKAAQALRIGVPNIGEFRNFHSEAPATVLFRDGAPAPSPTPDGAPGTSSAPVVNHAYATITGDTFRPGSEALVAYWREDFDFNDHHLHWHMVYPGGGYYDPQTKVVADAIDRRGELFLYMHSQIVARYDQDRLCWGLPLTKTWVYDDVLDQGYVPVPQLIDGYGARPPMHGWYPVRNPSIPDFDDAPLPIEKLAQWRFVLLQAIYERKVWICKTDDHTQRDTLALTDANMIDWCGNIIESAPLACSTIPGRPGWEIDGDVYGNLHNFGHDKFAEIGYHEYLSDVNPLGLMTSNFGSPRDPSFYLWHRHVAEFRELACEQFPQDITATAPVDVTVVALEIEPIDPHSPNAGRGVGTVMGPPSLDHGEANAKLDHEPYQWRITIQCDSASAANPVEVDVRLFVVCDALKAQRRTYVEMDKWPTTLTQPTTVLVRTDMESTTVRKIENYAGSATDQGYASPWCLCGWPRNMMLPVGTPEGFPMQAFCCVTVPKLHRVPEAELATPAISYCGAQLKDHLYPDDLGMGYPFDRAWTQMLDPVTLSLTAVIDAQKHMKLAPFSVYRSTAYYDGAGAEPPAQPIEWSTIHAYFRPLDTSCMKTEYGYDFNSEVDVTLHAAALYDALSSHRMPKDEVFWTKEMLETFYKWMHQPISKDMHERVSARALELYLTHGAGQPGVGAAGSAPPPAP